MKLDSGYVCLRNNSKIFVRAPPSTMTGPEQGYWDSFPDIY